jgi:hypothetical protein
MILMDEPLFLKQWTTTSIRGSTLCPMMMKRSTP